MAYYQKSARLGIAGAVAFLALMVWLVLACGGGYRRAAMNESSRKVGCGAVAATVVTIALGGASTAAALLNVTGWRDSLAKAGVQLSDDTAYFIVNWIFTFLVVAAIWTFAAVAIWYFNSKGEPETVSRLRKQLDEAHEEIERLEKEIPKIDKLGQVQGQMNRLARYHRSVDSKAGARAWYGKCAKLANDLLSPEKAKEFRYKMPSGEGPLTSDEQTAMELAAQTFRNMALSLKAEHIKA